MKLATIDFETANGDPECDLKEVGSFVYSEHICTEILCWGVNYNSTYWAWQPKHGIDRRLYDLAADPTVMFEAFNIGFERAIWKNQMLPLGYPDIPLERWHDAQASCARKALPLKLEMVLPVLRLQGKDKEGSKHTIALSRPNKQGYFDRSEAALSRAVEYVGSDVEIEVALSQRVGHLPPEERIHWLQNIRMNERGLRIDLDYVAKCQEVVDKASGPLIERFRELTSVNPTQGAKFLAWLKERGCELPNLTKETVANVLGSDIDDMEPDEDVDIRVELSAVTREALQIRQLVGSASVKKLARMAQCVCSDGRSRGLSQYHGTGPGRSAGRLFQPYNFPRGTLKGPDGKPPSPETVVDAIMSGDPDYVQMVLGSPPVESVVSGLRHAIISDPGNVFLSGDYSGIQARVVLALSGAHDKTAIMAAGQDIYCDMAGDIYKRPIDKKRDPEERQVGKNSVLGLGFGMGWRKFKLKYGQNLSDEFCKTIIDTYRLEWAPEVPKLWRGLEYAATQTVWTGKSHEAYGIEYRLKDGWLTARLPSGRKLFYWNPQKTRRAVPWDETDIRPGVSYQATKMGHLQTINAFGGQWTENVVMGIEVDIHRHGQLNCEKMGMPVVLEIYDEILVEVPETKADLETFHQCMLDVPEWAKGLRIPVAVEGWHGQRYRK